MNTRDHQTGEARNEPTGELICYVLSTPIEIVTIATRQRMLANFKQEIRAINTFHIMESHKATQPDQWHPIRGDETRRIMNLSDSFQPITFDNTMHPGETYVVPLTALNPTID